MNMQSSFSLPDLSANGSASNMLITQFFKNIRGLDTEEKILQAVVDVVYQTLKCDRAVIYSMQSDSYCQIVSEAVTPGFTQTLGMTIQDSCFESGYFDKYRRGRVRAITDIQQAGISSCHVESLENIEVKSNLVVPVVRQDNSLYGLLVMHQCSRTREWQQPEVEFVLQAASWVVEQLSRHDDYIALKSRVDNFQRVKEIVNVASAKIHRAKTSLEVLQQSVDQAKEIINCDRVIVYSLQNKSMGKIVAEATSQALAPIIGNVIKDPCFEYRYINQYQKGRIRAIPNIYEAGMSDCYVENLAKIGVKSNLVAPILWDNGQIYGLLVAHQCFSFKQWQSEEIEYFKDIAFHTGLSLSKARIKEQSQSLEIGLQQLSHVKDTISLAQTKIEQTQEPIQNSGKILVEVNNLNKLLEREINQINQDSSTQTRKDTKLIQIITRKLINVTSKIKGSLNTANNNSSEAYGFLDEAISHLDGGKSDLADS